nr:ribonuclease H-like domain-containing protein [Tanacetum cinerariifolium]
MMMKRIGEIEHIMVNLIQENKSLKQRLDSHGARLYTLEQLDIPHQVRKAIDEVVTDAIDWAMQAPLQNRFKDLPKVDLKEILHQRIWETDSYKSHKDHMQLYEALEKSMNRDHSKELIKDMSEVQKKKNKSRESPKMPPGSPPYQPPHPPPPAGPSRASGSPEASGSSHVPPPPPTPPSTNQEVTARIMGKTWGTILVGIFNLLAVATTFTGSGNLYCQWELYPGSGNALVLVNKSQNKTPYELFSGRAPAIGFLKPFSRHVMILNTLDNLGKFKAKGDEGYFIGYSMSSKAFRVFNKRTRRIEDAGRF